MNKKQMKKEQERLKRERNQVYMDFSDKQSVMKIVKISAGVIGFLLIVFVGINIFNGNWNIFTKKNKIASEIDSSLVLCGTMFSKQDSEYYVLAYDFNDETQSVYQALKESYSDTVSIYSLDVSSGFNSTCVGDVNNIVNDISKIKIVNPSLMHFKNGKIVKSYTTKDSIVNYLSKLK